MTIMDIKNSSSFNGMSALMRISDDNMRTENGYITQREVQDMLDYVRDFIKFFDVDEYKTVVPKSIMVKVFALNDIFRLNRGLSDENV